MLPARNPSGPAAAVEEVPGRPGRGRLTQLDGLRTWAVLGVFVEHYLAAHEDWWFVRASPGQLGVRLFFVLSGFLITGMLLAQKERLEEGRLGLGRALRLFYLRRLARLSPAYYAFLLVAALFYPAVREHALAFAAYVQNWLFVVRLDAYRTSLAHLWSLAIEEQFYLAWPLFVLTVPARLLPGAVAAVALLGGAFGLASGLAAVPPHTIMMATPTHLLPLAAGALVAVLGSPRYGDAALARRLSRLGLLAGPPVLAASLVLLEADLAWRLVMPLRDLGCALLFLWFVGRISVRVPPLLRGALLGRPVVYLGTISYGIYLFHMPLIDAFDGAVFPWLGVAPPAGLPRLALYGGTAVGLAALSWWALESRVQRLKDRLLADGPVVERPVAAGPAVPP